MAAGWIRLLRVLRMNPIATQELWRLVDQAVLALPDWVRERMDNVSIAVSPWPTQHQVETVRRQRGLTGMLLGLYEGIPLTRRGRGYHLASPDQITLFQRPLEMHARDSDELVALVQRTIIHEIGHHFGMSEDHLRELGI